MKALLYNSTCYNLLDSALSIHKLVKKAKEYNYEAIAICDHLVMHGVMDFYYACLKENIKPIIGLSVNVTFKDEIVHLLLYAKNNNGYLSLTKISSLINLNKNLSFSDLYNYEKDLDICLLFDGLYFENSRVALDRALLESLILNLSNNMKLLLGITDQNQAYLQAFNQMVYEIANQNNLQTIALPQSLYLEKTDKNVLKVLQAIKKQTTINDNNIAVAPNRHLLTIAELESTYDKNSITNAYNIAQSSNIDLAVLAKAKLPKFNTKVNSKAYLSKLCEYGLNKRLNNVVPQAYQKRLKEELSIITKMNFEDYFLLVYDFILFAKKKDIMTGPGRGSAAGSLVSYCLGITHVDPLKYNLVFERFLNPERISMPDIDVDIQDTGRDEVVEYLFNRQQKYAAAHIITFGTFKAKQALRDVGKALGLANYKIDQIAKAIPNALDINLSNVVKRSKKFNTLLLNDEKIQNVYQMALKIEGLPRHSSLHAAGVVLADSEIFQYAPIMMNNDMITTQYPMNYLEEFGLIKIDLLGLRNLTVINDIASEVSIKNIYDLPLNDNKVYQLLSSGKTLGIFQFESAGMRSLLTKMKPQNFEDIAAILALYRPGPMQFIDTYLTNRSENKIEYLHQDLKEILLHTYGIIVYQEQILQIAQKIAGFSLGKSDILRKAISKKQEKDIVALKQDFINGCKTNGYQEVVGSKVFSMIEKFANYGFNRAHSVSYALVAYQLAYLKTHYPLAFYHSLMNSNLGNENKINQYYLEAKTRKLSIEKPDINLSTSLFKLIDDKIVFPLTAIKGLGMINVNDIIKIRNKNNGFTDYLSAIVQLSKVTSANNLNNLIKVGA
ncbi:MAG: DNA polymerase III subunit alpha, partial [Erysipelotrichaceae bacterium]